LLLLRLQFRLSNELVNRFLAGRARETSHQTGIGICRAHQVAMVTLPAVAAPAPVAAAVSRAARWILRPALLLSVIETRRAHAKTPGTALLARLFVKIDFSRADYARYIFDVPFWIFRCLLRVSRILAVFTSRGGRA
jgi:hypothetical protein